MAEIKDKLKKIVPREFDSSHWKTKSRGILFRHEVKRFTKAFRENFVTLMVSSVGLLVALSWNDFWKSWVSSLSLEDTLNYKFYIALGTTVFAVLLTYFFSKLKNNGD